MALLPRARPPRRRKASLSAAARHQNQSLTGGLTLFLVMGYWVLASVQLWGWAGGHVGMGPASE